MSKRIIKANQKVLHDSMEEKKRFHPYKSGKLWLVAGLATLSFATGGLSSQLMPQSVHADVATSTAATKTDDSTTSSAATSSATSSSASSEASSATTSEATSTANSSSSKASSASSSEATSKATSKAADQNSSAASSSATSKANNSSASKASSAATTKSSSKATSAATKSAAATTNSSAVKKATTSAKSSAASSQELKTKFHLDDVATVKQTGNQLVFSVAANKKLTDEQYQAIVDYATRNHLKVKGLPKQAQATHKTSAGTDLSDQFFAKHSMDKNAAHDGDSITLNGDVVTINLLTDASHAHYLTHAETQKLYDYIKSKNLKVVDQTLAEYNSYYDAKGNLLSRNTDRSNYEGDFATIEYRCSDPLIGLFYQAGKENSKFWKDTKWNQDILDSRDGHWQIAGGEDNTSDDFIDNDLGLMFSHTINGAAASDSFIIATELKDESTSFYIDNGDGTKLDLFNDKDDVTNTISWSRTGEDAYINNTPAHYAGEHIGYIFSADQVNEFIRAQAYAYEHEGASFNGQQIDGQEAGRHNAIIQPLKATNEYQINQIINIYDADGNLLYYVTELATGGEIIVNSDATMADLLNTADDVPAEGNYDITDVFDNFANGLNGDGTKGDGIRYRVNDGKTPSNDPKGTGTGAYSGNYADSLADGAPDIDYYMIEQADATITYVDEDKDGAQVGDPVKVSGDINTSKDVTIDIPEGYEYAGTNGVISADGKTVTITLTDDDSDNVTILLKHHLTPVTPDDPSDPNYDATHATSHEIIHYIDENGDQVFEDGGGELNFTRTVTIDDVTNEVVEYGEWTPVTDGEFPAVTSPDKDGYTPDYPEVDAQTPDMTDGPDGTVKDIEVTVTYKADPAEATVFYVDDDNEGNVVKTEITKGKTDGLGIYTVKIPDGYEYVSAEGQTFISCDGNVLKIRFTADETDNATIHLKHAHKDVDPSDPDDPYYDATHDTATQIIHYVDQNGKTVFTDDKSQTLDYERTVTIDSVTGEITGYGDWKAVDGDEFGSVTSPDKPGYDVDKSEVSGEKPGITNGKDGKVSDVEETVTYTAVDEDATITYVDDDKNGAQVGDIVTVTGKTDDSTTYTVTIPDGYEYVGTDGGVVSADGKTVTITFAADDSDNVVIHLKHGHEDVDPSDPDDPYYDATHDTATQIIHYVDQNGKTVFTDDKSQTLDYERTVTIDSVTGEITGYGDWKAVDGDEFGSVTSPDKPGYAVDTKVVSGEKPGITNGKDGKVSDVEETVTYTAVDEDATITYVDDDKNGAQVGDIVTVTGKTDDSTTYTVTIPDGYEYVGTDGGVVSADGKTVTITFAADDSDNVVIHLKHGHKDVDPSDPDDPYYADTHATVTQTVHYRNGENGKQMQADTTNEVNFNRTVTIDSVTGEITHYGDWEAVGDDYFKDFDSPAFDGYFADVQHTSEVKGVEPEQGAVDDVTINYYATDQTVQPDDPKDNGDKVDPSNPNSPVYPAGVTDKDLNKTVTETIHYVDPETGKEVASDKTIVVHYTRVGHVIYNQDGTVKEVKYDDWVADGSFTDVDSPVVDGYFTDHSKAGAYTVGDNDDITNQGNFDTTVYYYKRDQPVDPSSPKNDGDKINPDDPFSPSYPDGVDYDDLNAEVKQEVHYVDQNGKELTGTYTITVHYTRTAVIHYDENGEVTGITYSDWDADGSFAAVQSPDIDGYFTLNTSVAGKTVTDPQNQADFSDTVIYYKTDQDVTPDDPKTPDTPVNPSDPDSPDYPDGVDYDDLNADVKETVHYVDENGNELAESYTKTVHYERTAHIKYDKDGNATVTYGDWTADGSFDAVQSPDVDGYFTLNKTVDGKTVTDPQHQADFEENVIYYPTNQDVTPDDPKTPDTPINPSDPDSPDYPDGVDYDDLNTDVKETVHYVDENGKELAGSYTKTVHYERTAHVSYDQNGNATVTYSDWSANGSFDAVQSPEIDGYFTLNKSVAGKTVTDPQGQPDFNETVIYYKTNQDVTPDDPKTPDTPINPSDPDR
ncbi:KxYKxGKxW signal peptide domain-containing protein [Pediococcus pentosaceus]|uniref:mucin-binding protein n=1 Tax=Pediococcus pentosaceus TaxID=1255 RepID=UPI00235DDD8D|nr:KxYKxGKxW signal peptide domain-containing protein [Pediococcus pentosaceus]MDD1390221.1 KxYKxGKxW signal peptide domain-containing protein [Pediococcus pentosaceus]